MTEITFFVETVLFVLLSIEGNTAIGQIEV